MITDSKLIILIVSFLLGTTVSAQDSLEHYMAVAIEKNAVVNQKYFEYKASLEKVGQSAALNDPQLNAGILLKPMELVMGKQLAEFQLMQMFPWFGTLRAAKDEMSLMANAKFESFRDSKLQTAFNIQKVWYEIYQISQQIEIAKDNQETLKSIERLAITRYKTTPTGNSAGNAPVISQNSRSNSSPQSMGSMEQANNGNITSNVPDAGMNSSSMGTTGSSFGLPDIYRIQIEIGDLRNNMAYLESQLKVLVAQLNSYMNRPSGSIIVSPDTLVADSLKYSLHLLKDSMLVNNPMLAMLNFEKQSLEARKKMVTKMGYPMIGLGLNYTIIKKDEMSQEKMNGKDMVMPMISTTIPIYRKKYKSMKNEADYLILASQNNMEATAHALEVEFEQAVQLYEDALRRRQLYDEQRKLSQKSLDIMFKKFSASSADLTDVLRFRQQVLDYGFKYTEALVDLKTSEAWLNRLSGGFNPNFK